MPRTTLSTESYKLPAVRLVRDDGTSVSFPSELDDGRPVVMNISHVDPGGSLVSPSPPQSPVPQGMTGSTSTKATPDSIR